MIPNIFGFDPQDITIIIAAGLFIWLTLTRLDKTGIGSNNVNKLVVVCIISSFTLVIGATFFDNFWHAIENNFFSRFPTLVKEWGLWEALFRTDDKLGPDSQGFFGQGGITYLGALYGALFGYVISYWFIYRHERHKIVHFLNIILPGLILAHAIGRVGCFLSGCCTGIAAPKPWGIIFPNTANWHRPEGYINPSVTPVLPTNLYEAIFLFGLFFILIFALKKNQTKVYMVSYGVFRFLIEFLRGDSRGKVPVLKDISFLSWVSPSQLLSFILIIIGVLLFIFEDKLTEYLKKWDKPIIKKKVQKVNKTKESNA